MAFSQNFTSLLTEIEGSMPGRFYPGAHVYAERVMTADGHFIRVLCPGAEGLVPCPEKRERLEARALEVTLLRSLPSGQMYDDLYDPDTWEKTDLGEDTLDKAKDCWPDLKSRVAAAAVDAIKKPR